MPQCDSSQTCTRAVWPKPSPADLLPSWAAGVSEVSRFSCMKFLGVLGFFDYAGLSRNSRYRSSPCCLPRMLTASASGLYLFGAQSPTPTILHLRFAGSLTVAAQDSRPSGSLLLSCKTLSSPTSCRFSPHSKSLNGANRRHKLVLRLDDSKFRIAALIHGALPPASQDSQPVEKSSFRFPRPTASQMRRGIIRYNPFGIEGLYPLVESRGES